MLFISICFNTQKSYYYVLNTFLSDQSYKAAESRGEFIRNKIADKIAKSKTVSNENSRNVEEIIIVMGVLL